MTYRNKIKAALKKIYLLLISIMICACSTPNLDFTKDINDLLPEQFSLYEKNTNGSDFKNWWDVFNSEELDYLINFALTNSPSMDQMWARLEQAQALAEKKGSASFPIINMSASGLDQNDLDGISEVDNWSSGLIASYELDLWGRIKSIKSAAKTDVLSSIAAVEIAFISMSAEVALRWNELISKELELCILENQLDSNLSSLELIELRFNNSLASALDVFQQKQIVEKTKALIPLVKREIGLLSSELSNLLGVSYPVHIKTSSLSDVQAIPNIGIPADLLANRPDVRKAGLDLQSANWLISAAKADRLPSISLGGRIESSDTESSGIIDNWISSLSGSLISPIFDGRSKKAEQERVAAIAKEKLGIYKETVLDAIIEVEKFLLLEQTQKAYLIALQHQFDAAKMSYNEAISRYKNGATEYTTVLLQLNTMQELERIIIKAKANQIAYRIGLHRALGGNSLILSEYGDIK